MSYRLILPRLNLIRFDILLCLLLNIAMLLAYPEPIDELRYRQKHDYPSSLGGALGSARSFLCILRFTGQLSLVVECYNCSPFVSDNRLLIRLSHLVLCLSSWLIDVQFNQCNITFPCGSTSTATFPSILRCHRDISFSPLRGQIGTLSGLPKINEALPLSILDDMPCSSTVLVLSVLYTM